MPEVLDIVDANLAPAKAFLELAPETSLFLLSNLRAFGPRLADSLYSGNFKGIMDGGQLAAVFCLTRGGSLVLQTGGRTDLSRVILDAARTEPMPIRGVLGEWNASSAIWGLLCDEGRVRETIASKEILYRLSLAGPLPDGTAGFQVRQLTPNDHDRWEPLSVAFQKEINVPLLGEREQRKSSFERSSRIGHWWGAFVGDELVSMSGIIALHRPIAQIGGVYTVPDRRRQGLNRAVIATLIRDSREVHRLERLFLFTGETNTAARRLYESFGFESFGHFGLFYGDPQP